MRFTFGQLYPKVLKRDVGPEGFVDLIRARYGSRADGLVKDFMRHRVRMISNAGVIEMSRGNMVGARRCFIRVLRYDPRHVKSYTRIARTFLPAPIRRALGGKASTRLPYSLTVGAIASVFPSPIRERMKVRDLIRRAFFRARFRTPLFFYRAREILAFGFASVSRSSDAADIEP